MLTCILQSVTNSTVRVPLPHNKLVYVGRSLETNVSDPAVSRKQLALKANYRMKEVEIETLGSNYSGCNGYALRKNSKYVLKDGDRIELRIGMHIFDVIFKNSPKNFIEQTRILRSQRKCV